MQARTEQGKAERLESIVALLREKIPAEQRGPVEAFTRAYFRQVDAEDLAERDPADLYGAALSHWNFARKREAGKPRVRVFNPSVEEHGWQSTHTVIEIVNDDMPFLVDSVTMEVNRHGLTLHLIIHPIMRVNARRRDVDGRAARRLADRGAASRSSTSRSTAITDPARLEALAADLGRVLGDVRVAVEDWKAMPRSVREIVADLDRRPPPVGRRSSPKARAFLAWLADDHFTFLGYRDYDLVVKDGEDALAIVPGSGLGILREQSGEALATSFSQLPPQVRALRARAGPADRHQGELALDRAPAGLPRLHRRQALRRRGEVIGEHRFLGPVHLHRVPRATRREIPLLRRKVADVSRARRPGTGQPLRQGARATSSRTIRATSCSRSPRTRSLETAMGILHLGERQRFRLFVRRDLFERFVSCLIYVPRENYNTELREKWQAILTKAFNGQRRSSTSFLSESMLARIHDHGAHDARADPAGRRARARGAPRRTRRAAGRTTCARRSSTRAGEARGNELYRHFGAAFPAGYREDVPARTAVPDIEMMAKARAGGGRGDEPLPAARGAARAAALQAVPPGRARCRSPTACRCSSDMGLRVLEERPYRIAARAGAPVWMHDFGLAHAATPRSTIDAVGALFEDAFGRGLRRRDRERRLQPPRARRACSPPTRSWCCAPTRSTCGRSGSRCRRRSSSRRWPRNPAIARMLVDALPARFDPAKGDAEGASAAGRTRSSRRSTASTTWTRTACCASTSRSILATMRTNFWRRDADGRRRAFLSFKFDPSKVPGLPEPEADVRDLRLLAALRGRAPARRQGRARRPALVRPAARTSAPRCSAW